MNISDNLGIIQLFENQITPKPSDNLDYSQPVKSCEIP